MRQPGRLGERIRRLIRGRVQEASSVSLAYLGITYGAAVALYGLGGWWLDKKLGTLPWFTMLGVAVGAVGGFIWVYREVIRSGSRSKRAGKGADAGEETKRP